GAAEDQPAEPVDERALAVSGELVPAGDDVLAERRRGLGHLPVHGQVDQVLPFGTLERAGHEPELDGRLLNALGEVALVEREAELAVLEDVVRPGFVVSASRRVHHEQTCRALPYRMRRRHRNPDSSRAEAGATDFAPSRKRLRERFAALGGGLRAPAAVASNARVLGQSSRGGRAL